MFLPLLLNSRFVYIRKLLNGLGKRKRLILYVTLPLEIAKEVKEKRSSKSLLPTHIGHRAFIRRGGWPENHLLHARYSCIPIFSAILTRPRKGG